MKLLKENLPSYMLLELYIWGLGIGDWELGPIPNPQSPTQ